MSTVLKQKFLRDILKIHLLFVSFFTYSKLYSFKVHHLAVSEYVCYV